ncbi:alpha/beta hydrolase [Pseudofrankia asymbiotica]|uniref:alpha/beta hydrolase n=1 Tax=Pseudofrankia asymbiotica TaxID=1834516 RepID=UPI001F522B4D|nr:alpha/beta hydrolase [Pseudofrankia asymbiotica]
MGDSTGLPTEITNLPTVAAANHAAVVTILDRMRAGSLAEGIAPFRPGAVVGAGQSLGGHALAGMQAYHRTFDAVAMLGSSMAGTNLPLRPGRTVPVPDGATAEQATLARMAGADWAWIFHWEDPGATARPVPPDGGDDEGAALAVLVAADIAAGVPARHTPPPWGAAAYPGFSLELMMPGALAAQVALIDVPVLLASGERDVCRSPAEEIAGFRAATDLSVLVVRRMAHMHNFAPTRATLWNRLDEFVSHAAGFIHRG